MAKGINLIKSIFFNGVFFLVPLFVLFIVVQKAYDLVRRIAKPIARLIPDDFFLHLWVQDLIAVVLLVLICMLVGLFARSRMGKRRWLMSKIENSILVHLPGYSIVKGMSEHMTGILDQDGQQVVMVRFDDAFQIGFLMEGMEGKENLSAIYIPDTPNPWSGSLYFISNDRIQHLNITYTEAITCIKKGGVGGKAILQKKVRGK